MQGKRTIIVLDDSDDEVQQVLDTAPVAPRGCKKQKTDPKTSTSYIPLPTKPTHHN